jgi:hypothetical protein
MKHKACVCFSLHGRRTLSEREFRREVTSERAEVCCVGDIMESSFSDPARIGCVRTATELPEKGMEKLSSNVVPPPETVCELPATPCCFSAARELRV